MSIARVGGEGESFDVAQLCLRLAADENGDERLDRGVAVRVGSAVDEALDRGAPEPGVASLQVGDEPVELLSVLHEHHPARSGRR